jgi:hypothetical protein
MAVYVFCTQTDCLKVGKAGPNSEARFTSQHYNPNSSPSNLSKSIFQNNFINGLTENDVGNWIRQNTERHHFYISTGCNRKILSLLEIFIQCRLNPKYEAG